MTEVLAKRLAHVVEKLVGNVQTCTIPGKLIQNNLHLMHYTLERVNKLSHKCRALVRLDLSKAFDRVDHQYLLPFMMALNLQSR